MTNPSQAGSSPVTKGSRRKAETQRLADEQLVDWRQRQERWAMKARSGERARIAKLYQEFSRGGPAATIGLGSMANARRSLRESSPAAGVGAASRRAVPGRC